MPTMTPVANTIIPPNPQQGINTFSGILGIRQQQQALETGQYQQASAKASSAQDQQKNAELQALARFTKSAIEDPSYQDGKGNLDTNKFRKDATAVAPVYGLDSVDKYIAAAQGVIKTKQAINSLTQEQNQTVAGYLKSVAGNPDASKDDYLEAFRKSRAVDPQNADLQESIDRAIMHMGPVNDSRTLQQAGVGLASMFAGESPNAPSTMDTGGQIQPGLTGKFTGRFNPAGAPVAKTTPPALTTNQAGQIVRVAPGGGAAEPVGGANPTTAQAQTGIKTAAGVTERVQQAQAQANNTVQTQDALSRSLAILENKGPATGTLFDAKKHVANFFASIGGDSKWAEDNNTLVKNMARYEAARATSAGLGGTDAARELSHNGSPNTSLDKAALSGILRQSLATEKAIAAYANIQTKTQDPEVLARNEAAFRSIPHLIEGYEYGLSKSPKEADEFLKKHGLTKEEMRTTRQKIKAFEAQ